MLKEPWQQLSLCKSSSHHRFIWDFLCRGIIVKDFLKLFRASHQVLIERGKVQLHKFCAGMAFCQCKCVLDLSSINFSGYCTAERTIYLKMSLNCLWFKASSNVLCRNESGSQKGGFKPPFKQMEVSTGLAVGIVVNLGVDILSIGLNIQKVFKMSVCSLCTALVIETCGQSYLQTIIKIYIFN